MAATDMFSGEELRDISVLKRGNDYLEVMCGSTHPRVGDFVGKIRVFTSGKLEIACECVPDCPEDKLTPVEFMKHIGREDYKKWKNKIWIFVDGYKVSLVMTALLKYYNQSPMHDYVEYKFCHRDEFIICTKCKKQRRFHCRSKKECKIYHDALVNTNWKCSDFPFRKFICDEEERSSRRVSTGCLRSSTCEGCTSCVCSGCEVCRFSDCICQLCIDFTNNAEA